MRVEGGLGLAQVETGQDGAIVVIDAKGVILQRQFQQLLDPSQGLGVGGRGGDGNGQGRVFRVEEDDAVGREAVGLDLEHAVVSSHQRVVAEHAGARGRFLAAW